MVSKFHSFKFSDCKNNRNGVAGSRHAVENCPIWPCVFLGQPDCCFAFTAEAGNVDFLIEAIFEDALLNVESREWIFDCAVVWRHGAIRILSELF